MARPLTGGASTLERTVVTRHDDEEDSRKSSFEDERGVATAVGSVVHRMMENLDFDEDLAAQLGEGLNRESADLELDFDGKTLAVARERLSALVDLMASGVCLDFLASVAPGVMGREIAIVAPPHEDGGPIGAVTGFVDLVYRDPEDGRVVVADYKTDSVEDDAALEERTCIYEPQVRTYARALREALTLDYEPHVELWFLAADRIVRLQSDEG